MDTLPLDLQSLLSEINKDESSNAIPFPTGGRIGHIHLRVTNLERSIRFYHEQLTQYLNPVYCNCNEFEKAVDYNDIRYYRPEDDRFNAVKNAGWYMYSMGYERPIASLEPFKYCPGCAKKLTRP